MARVGGSDDRRGRLSYMAFDPLPRVIWFAPQGGGRRIRDQSGFAFTKSTISSAWQKQRAENVSAAP